MSQYVPLANEHAAMGVWCTVCSSVAVSDAPPGEYRSDLFATRVECSSRVSSFSLICDLSGCVELSAMCVYILSESCQESRAPSPTSRGVHAARRHARRISNLQAYNCALASWQTYDLGSAPWCAAHRRRALCTPSVIYDLSWLSSTPAEDLTQPTHRWQRRDEAIALLAAGTYRRRVYAC